MLGKTAGGLYWMFRYLERSENTARLVHAGFRIALTRFNAASDEWASVLTTAGVRDAYDKIHDEYDAAGVVDFLLRNEDNPSSVMSSISAARSNARLVRTAITREVWEATNESWMTLRDALADPIRERDLPELLDTIRQQSALVRGALHGTMLRNDNFCFSNLGTVVERADSTARLMDVKYYVLLPSLSYVGSSIDNVQWETILRAASAHRAFHWLNGGDSSPGAIIDLLVLDRRFPRSLVFCCAQMTEWLTMLEQTYGARLDSQAQAEALYRRLTGTTVDEIFDIGLHEFLTDFIQRNNALGQKIEEDYRFNG